MKAKPDCTGQRFGYLTVLGKEGKHPKTNRQLWSLKCDCGNVINLSRGKFDSKFKSPSCGCKRAEVLRNLGIKRRKPDCTGQRFGRLVVLGIGGRIPDRGSYRQLWRLQCDCGKIIERPRNSFEQKRQVSCGCKKLGNSGRRSLNIAGQKFGTLTAIALTENRKSGKPAWSMQCDCGNTCQRSLSNIRRYQYHNIRINCGDRAKHPEKWLGYPPTPNPYPEEAGELLIKYLHLIELNYIHIDTAVEDLKRDRLFRAAWILTYRRQQGEEISALHEARIIRKHLRYCSIDVFWKRKLESSGGFLYNVSDKKKEIGDAMTDLIPLDYPVIETQGTKLMPVNSLKHLKFRRC